jgi:hypothetical protein
MYRSADGVELFDLQAFASLGFFQNCIFGLYAKAANGGRTQRFFGHCDCDLKISVQMCVERRTSTV